MSEEGFHHIFYVVVGLVVAVHAQEYVVFPWAPTGGGHSAENCGFSTVPVHQQGLQHSCRGADADSLGLEITADHRVSTVAQGQGVRCPWCAGRAGFSAR